jgi:hypothetical protein
MPFIKILHQIQSTAAWSIVRVSSPHICVEHLKNAWGREAQEVYFLLLLVQKPMNCDVTLLFEQPIKATNIQNDVAWCEIFFLAGQS